MEWQTVQIVGSIVAFVWGVSWFLASKIDTSQKTVMDKLEGHERQDDIRFEKLHNNIWEIRINNALHGINGNDQKRPPTLRRTTAEETPGGI